MILLDYIPKYNKCPLCDEKLVDPIAYRSCFICSSSSSEATSHFVYQPMASWARVILDDFVVVIDESETRIHSSGNMKLVASGKFPPVTFNKVLDLSSPVLVEYIKNIMVIS